MYDIIELGAVVIGILHNIVGFFESTAFTLFDTKLVPTHIQWYDCKLTQFSDVNVLLKLVKLDREVKPNSSKQVEVGIKLKLDVG